MKIFIIILLLTAFAAANDINSTCWADRSESKVEYIVMPLLIAGGTHLVLDFFGVKKTNRILSSMVLGLAYSAVNLEPTKMKYGAASTLISAGLVYRFK